MSDRVIKVSTELNCSTENAFDFFAKNERLVEWLAPKADVEMVEGGKYELFWSPDDNDMTNNSTYGCRVLAVDRPYYFSIEWKGTKDHKSFMNYVSPLTNVTVVFSGLSDGRTRVSLVHTGWRQGTDWESAYQFFVHAWTGAFIGLEKLVNSK